MGSPSTRPACGAGAPSRYHLSKHLGTNYKNMACQPHSAKQVYSRVCQRVDTGNRVVAHKEGDCILSTAARIRAMAVCLF